MGCGIKKPNSSRVFANHKKDTNTEIGIYRVWLFIRVVYEWPTSQKQQTLSLSVLEF